MFSSVIEYKTCCCIEDELYVIISVDSWLILITPMAESIP